MLSDVKCNKVLQVLEDNEIKIGCISETWFDSENGKFTQSIKEAGYKLTHGFRENKGGGGTAILYNDQLNVKPIGANSNIYTSFEFSTIKVPIERSKVILACIYRKQEYSCNQFCEEFEGFLEELFQKGDKMIIVGDFNVWVDVEGNTDSKRILNMMNSYGLTQIVKEPTQRNGHTLDQVYVNLFQIDVRYEVIDEDLDISDHNPILLKIPSVQNQQKIQNIFYRKTKNIDAEILRSDFRNAFNVINQSYNMEFKESYELYDEITRTIVDKHAPLVSRKVKLSNDPRWMDLEFKQNRSLRRKLERKWKMQKTDTNREAYVKQRNLCAEMCINKKKQYYSKIISEAENDQKRLFSIASEVLDRNKVKVLPEYEDPVKLANSFNEYYVDKIKKIRSSIPTISENVVTPKYFEGEPLDSFVPTTIADMEEIIKEFDIKTSPEDPIPKDILKMIIKEAIPTLVDLVNKSLATGSMDGVKLSVIDPLLKKCGLDSDVKKNYRPVNNLLFFSKIIERVVAKQLNQHMTINNLHTDTAFAYKKFHNTENMMLGMTDEILEGFDNNKCTVVLFLDLSAAFDTIDIDRLLLILEQELGITGTAKRWINSFLRGRLQKVRIDGVYSDSLLVMFGVPQGSILGPMFFPIYVRGQPDVFMKCKFLSSAFADDSNGRKTFSVSFQYNILKHEIPNCINEITNWMNYQFLKINPDKTEILLFYPKSMENEVIIRGTMIAENKCIRFSDVVKNVGVWLDKNLDMTHHINKIVSHSYKILKDISRIRSVISKKNTEMLVHSVISSRLDYCNSLLYNISKSNLNKFQKVQNAAARIVLRKRKTQSVTQDMKGLHWLRIESRIIFKILLIVDKSMKGKSSKKVSIDLKNNNNRNEDQLKLKISFAKTKYGERRYKYVAPRLWNALPLSIRNEEKIETFKKKVKSLLIEDSENFINIAFRYLN